MELQATEELFVMVNEVKILLPNEQVASVYCRIYYALKLPNSHTPVEILTYARWERTSPEGPCIQNAKLYERVTKLVAVIRPQSLPWH